MFCRDKYLKKGLKLAKFKDQLRIRYHSETENATVAHRYTQEDAKEKLVEWQKLESLTDANLNSIEVFA